MIKDIFGIQVIVTVNVINDVILVRIQIIKIVNTKKWLIDKLVDECSEAVEEVKWAIKTLF